MSFLTDDKKKILDSFVQFVKEQLELKTVPTIKVQNNRDGLTRTGADQKGNVNILECAHWIAVRAHTR